MKLRIIDCETDGLLDVATKIHVLSWTDDGENFYSIFDYDEMRDFLNESKWLMCHNGIRFDAEVFRKILGVDLTGKMFDTLALSWYINPDRTKSHGLEAWGEELGVAKPQIDDWENLTQEQYQHRCEEDVKINWLLWQDIYDKLWRVYRDKENMFRFMKYISFKMECAAEQERIGWRLDVDRVQRNIDELSKLEKEKTDELRGVMPLVPKYEKKSRPKVVYKKDGGPSSHGIKWLGLLEEHGLPEDYDGEVEVLKGFEPPNPGSDEQIKSWLFDLGWEPCYYKFTKTKAGENKVPQIRKDGHLTPSVEKLIEKAPQVKVLSDLSVVQHRLGFFKALMEEQKDGWVKATVQGLTNTLRFKHARPLANIPGVEASWGSEIRGSLIAPDDETILCGCDMSSLESTTKRHYMYPLDPDYVKEMSQPDFDEHLDLAVSAGYCKEEDYKWYMEDGDDPDRYKSIKKIRSTFKPVNYGSVYGIGKVKLARELGCTEREAKKLIDAYWERNWAVKELVKDLQVRYVKGQMWLLNPVSGFWYSLRYDKDKFSTLNQGTGVYCFDTWLAYVRAQGIQICGQFHDEEIHPLKKSEVDTNTEKLYSAIRKTNNKLKLNVDLDISVQYGKTYADIH